MRPAAVLLIVSGAGLALSVLGVVLAVAAFRAIEEPFEIPAGLIFLPVPGVLLAVACAVAASFTAGTTTSRVLGGVSVFLFVVMFLPWHKLPERALAWLGDFDPLRVLLGLWAAALVVAWTGAVLGIVRQRGSAV